MGRSDAAHADTFLVNIFEDPGNSMGRSDAAHVFSQAEKLFSVVTGTFFFCKINDFAWQYHLFCVAIPIRLRTKINYIAGKDESFGRA